MGLISTLFGGSKPSEESKFETLRDDGVRAMQMGELPYAEKCLMAALELKDDAKTLSFLAEVELRMRNHEKALPLLQKLSAQLDDELEVDLLLAQTYGVLKQYDEERATCSHILEKHADEPRALYLLAEADNGLGDQFMAIAHLTQSLNLRPDYQQALYLRADVLRQMGQWSEVLADANALVAANGENEQYLILRAEAYAALSQTEEAVADLQHTLELNPYSDEAVLKLGSLYEQTSLWDKALALYDEAIEMRPDFAAAYKARGGVKNHLKDTLGAADDLKRSLELAPEKASDLDGEYTNVENEMNDRYKRMNPYGF